MFLYTICCCNAPYFFVSQKVQYQFVMDPVFSSDLDALPIGLGIDLGRTNNSSSMLAWRQDTCSCSSSTCCTGQQISPCTLVKYRYLQFEYRPRFVLNISRLLLSELPGMLNKFVVQGDSRVPRNPGAKKPISKYKGGKFGYTVQRQQSNNEHDKTPS